MYLLRIETVDGLMYFFFALIAVVIWFYLLRWATKASEVAKNQEIIIHILGELYKKNGATKDEVKQLEEYIINK